MNNEPFATVDELAAFWRPLTDEEKTRAELLLQFASDNLRQLAKNSNRDLDQMITDGVIMSTAVKLVVMAAVKRAMLTPTNLPPVTNYSQTAGPYSENYTYTNPAGDIWFKKAELAMLGLGAGGSQTVGSMIVTVRKDIYGE